MEIDTNDSQYIGFDYHAYYVRYHDIARALYLYRRKRDKNINAKLFAWKHYILYGKEEGRQAEFKYNTPSLEEEEGEKTEQFVITSKETFREACTRELPHARSIIIPKAVKKEPRLETVLIEFRWFPHLEFLVRNMVIKLHHWNHTIVCGNKNFQDIKTMCKSICPDIRIIRMDIDNLVPSTYSELLTTKPFWEQFHGEKLLIYQEDSFLFHERIEPFLDYDYVGAPWPKGQHDNKLCVGNGGFSLRTKTVMIKVIENVKMESLELGKNTIEYMKNTNSFVVPEDVYFTKAMIDFKLGWVAPWEIARKFSQEAIPSENPLGGHNFFLANHEHNNLSCGNTFFADGMDRIHASKYLFTEICMQLDVPSMKNAIMHEKSTTNVQFYNDDCATLYDNKSITFTPWEIPTKVFEYMHCIPNFFVIIDFPYCFGGGTKTFMKFIVGMFKEHQTFLHISKKSDNHDVIDVFLNDDYFYRSFTEDEIITFMKENIYRINKIFVNHIMFFSTDFFQRLSNIKEHVDMDYITHDYASIYKTPQPYFSEIVQIEKENSNYLNYFDNIITQNQATVGLLRKHTQKPIIVANIPDFKYSDEIIEYNQYNGKKIRVAAIGNFSDADCGDRKGRHFIQYLAHYCRNTNIEMIVIGLTGNMDVPQYTFNDIYSFNECLRNAKPNIILEASLWPETWSYTLTLAMLSSLPIISIHKDFIENSVVCDRLKGYDKIHYLYYLQDFKKLCNKIKQEYCYTVQPKIVFNTFWNSYFGKVHHDDKLQHFHNPKNGVLPYVIFFPQFHSFHQNNVNFYNGYDDLKNLLSIKKDLHIKGTLPEPSVKELNIKTLTEYTLSNDHIIKQFLRLLNMTNIEGIALYYYWFSFLSSKIDDENMLMKSVVDKIFNVDMNKKIFFIWCNENWSDNPAFGNTSEYIVNEYNREIFLRNSDNLIRYFQHKNYLKIDNKPVLFIYHSFLLTTEELRLFRTILEEKCIRCGFSGVNIVLNSMSGENVVSFKHFYLNFNYKVHKDNVIYYDAMESQTRIDYRRYVHQSFHYPQNNIQSISLSFDNRPRLYKPYRMNKSTRVYNNSIVNKIHFIKKIMDEYDASENNTLDKILLINSWNEWGENMAIEPSKEYGYNNLNLVQKIISD